MIERLLDSSGLGLLLNNDFTWDVSPEKISLVKPKQLTAKASNPKKMKRLIGILIKSTQPVVVK